MLFKSLFSLAVLATSVIADGASIRGALTDVDEKTLGLKSAIDKWDGQFFGALPILSAQQALADSLTAGTKTADDSAPLTQEEALTLVDPATKLTDDVRTTLDSLVDAKPKFDKLFISSFVLSIIQMDKKSADDFKAAVVNKVPAELQPVAESIVAPIDEYFNQAIAAYSS